MSRLVLDTDAKCNSEIEKITFIVKTFERAFCIKRLVKSIIWHYPNAKILIADDSEKSCKNFFKKKYPEKMIEVFELQRDCGLSFGRNYLLKKVVTPFFVLLDDDFVFDKRTDIVKALHILEDKQIDILGGYFRNYSVVVHFFDIFHVWIEEIFKQYKCRNYIGILKIDEESKTLYADYIQNSFPEYIETDITHNFFIGKTETIREKNNWNEKLKLQEHTAFFIDAKRNGIRVGFSNAFSVKHKPIRTRKYDSFRRRNFQKLFMDEYGLERIISSYDGEKGINI